MRNLFIFFVIFVFITCGKDSPTSSIGKDNLVLSTIDLIFLSEGEEKTFTITCDSDWTISCAAPWCKVVPVSGTGDAEITVITDSYEDYYDRNTKLSVAMGDSVQFIMVTQKKKNTILLAKDKYTVPSTGEIITVEVRSNVDYNVAIPAECKEWIKEIQQARTLEPKNLKFKIAANETAGKRNGIIVFEDKATTFADTVFVFQEQEYLIFSDDVFQQYLLDNFDMNNDGRFSILEAASVDTIALSDGVSLENMYYFSNLKSLAWENFKQEDIDLSENVLLEFVECFSNGLTSLDVSKCNLLTELRCCFNEQLTTLEVSGCTSLKELFCQMNQISSLDVSNCFALIGIACYDNQLTTLDLTNNTELTILSCGENQLTDLDVSKNALLKTLYCSDNQLTTLNVSGCTSLAELLCDNNQLATLDVSSCTSLTELYCVGNPNLKTIYKKKGQKIRIEKPENTQIIEK